MSDDRTNLVEFMGEPYISLEALQTLVADMAGFIVAAAEGDEDVSIVLPGAHAVLVRLDEIFKHIRVQYAESKDLAPEAVQTIKEIYDFLGE